MIKTNPNPPAHSLPCQYVPPHTKHTILYRVTSSVGMPNLHVLLVYQHMVPGWVLKLVIVNLVPTH